MPAPEEAVREGYPKAVLELSPKAALKMAGFEFTEDKLNQLGVRILSEKYKFKFREGFNPEKLKIPKRIMDTVSPVGNLDEKFIRDTIKSYMSKVL